MVDNPYVGPRTFTRQESDRFFGREQEADDLRALVMTERLVLFYAQSGAGKSSLINTRLIPHLQAAGLAVLPIGRVSGELPEGVTDVDNIFIFNLLLSLEQGNSPPQRLSRMTLPTFLTHLASDDGEHYYFDDSPPPDEADYQNPRHILIIDQFEEIVTSHLECWPEREDFFRQLNQVMLEDPQLWVLLTLREDHLAALEPYAPLLRDKMRARYYMPQMGSEAALAAVREPDQQFGRPFATDVAETLVDNLRQIRGLLAADIGSGRRLGQFVEPVQLQVVCYQLWENLKYSPPGEITAHDLQTYGNVDVTLTDFYESALQAAVQQTGLSERRLRSWFSTRLITPTHTRDMAFRDEQTGQTEGLPNAAVDVLTNAYIIRADTRSSGTWYELTHDRLVEPILEANLRWKADYHNPVATAYRVWHDSGRIREKLLRGEALAEAQTFANTRPAEITDEEQTFLADSARQAEAEQELARQRAQRQRYTIIGIMLIAILMGLLAVWGWRSAVRAEREAERATRAEATAEHGREEAIALARDLAIARVNADASARDAEAQAEAAVAARTTADVARVTAEAARVSADLARATAEAARFTAEAETRRAETQTKLANARQIKLVALNLLEQKAQIAMLLGLEAKKLSADAGQEVIQQAPYHFPPIETMLHGHSDSALTVAWRPDGFGLASSSIDNKIIIWDVDTFKPIKTLEQPDGSNTYELSWSPDGQKLAATAGLESIIWDVPSGEYDTLKQGSGTVVSVAWSPDGQKLASGLADATVVVWDLASSPLVSQTLRGHQDIVNHVAWSPAGTELASASDDRQIIVWDLTVSSPLSTTLRGHQDIVNHVAWSPAGTELASASDDRTIILWDVASGEPVATLEGHVDPVNSVVWSPDGTKLASGSSDSTIILWDRAAERADQIWREHQGFVREVAWQPGGRYVASVARGEPGVVIWDAAVPLNLLEEHTESVYSVEWGRGHQFASGSADNNVILWDLDSDIPPQVLSGHDHLVLDLAWSPDQSQLASVSWDNRIIIWDLAQQQAAARLESGGDKLWSVAWQPNGSRLAVGSADNKLEIWDLTGTTPYTLTTLQEHAGGRLLDLDWSPDGQYLASGSDDNTVLIYDSDNWQTVASLEEHDSDVFSVGWSTDGTKLASGSDDNTVIVWDTETWSSVERLTGHSGIVLDIAWNSDGTQLASASADQTIIIWDVARQQPLTTLRGHDHWVWSVGWSEDGAYFASGSDDTTVRVLDAKLLNEPCQWLTRNLTFDEWQTYMPRSISYHRTCLDYPLPADLVSGSQEAARTLVEQSKTEEAIAQLQHLLILTPTVGLDPETEVQHMVEETVERLVDEGRTLAWEGKVEEATAKFQHAKQLDPSLRLDPAAQARHLAQPTFENAVTAATDWASRGDNEGARLKFEAAFDLAASLNSAEIWHRLCVAGGRWQQADVVLEACNKAIKLQPNNGQFYNSRAVVRLQLGDTSGAREDFAEFEKWLANLQSTP